MLVTKRILFCLAALLMTALSAQAETSKKYGPYELHYSVVNTTFLTPEIASNYGIVRSEKRAFVNLALRKKLEDGSTVAVPMLLKGSTNDLIQSQDLEFKEIREQQAIYYIAEFSFINEEWRHFDIHFRPEGTDTTQNLKFKHQLYKDLD